MGNLGYRTWSDILVALRSQAPELTRPWFSTLEPLDLDHGVIRVGVATAAHHEYLSNQCQTAFNRAAQSVTGRLVTVEFAPPTQPRPDERPLSFEEGADDLLLDRDYTFENFVTGPENRLAHAACVAVAESPGEVYNPLFIHGAVGLGKTHLLQAVCHQIHARNHGSGKVAYLSCETFTNHYVEAIERGAVHKFRQHYRHMDVLIIDDIQFLAAREQSREEFFHTYNTLYQSHRQIILSADEPPNGIPSLEDRLVSRFNWGLVARIDLPCLETRMAIVRKKAGLRCADLPEDVVHHIAATVHSNTRELEGALTRVLATAQQYGGAVTLDIARQALGDLGPARSRQISIIDIMEVVSEHFSIRLADLQGKRRNRSVAFPRQVCMRLARILTSLSFEEIGGYFGGRDHTTVLHADRTIGELCSQNVELQQTLDDLTAKLRQRLA
ncbi:MAG: chromosomal replication initiator protein DnaA [Phycisphaerae bacterium]|nr:chromosomal replication initiator protein DnaA [Phycisphaerae bacterium]